MNKPIERLYTDTEAAEVLGIKPRSLRTERSAGRIGFKRVAGKVMYRHRDLVNWMNQGEEPCQDATEDRTSLQSKGAATSMSHGQKTDAADGEAQVRRISRTLKASSKTSSPADPDGQGRVIRANFQS